MSLLVLHMQAHMQARYVILRVLLECDPPLLSIEHMTGGDGKPDLMIMFNKSNLETVGKPKIGEFLKKLQVIDDMRRGCILYTSY